MIKFSCCFLLLATLYGCQYNCEEIEEPIFCPTLPAGESELLITDFSSGEFACQHIGSWGEGDNIVVTFHCENDGTNSFGRLTITGNDSEGPQGWSGGGLVLPLSDCLDGFDLTAYRFLKLDLRANSGGYLHFSKFNLKDREDKEGQERPLQAYDTLTEEWKTFSIPLNDFIGSTVSLDLLRAANLITVAVNNGTYPFNIDGTLDIDNVRLEL